MGLEEADFGMTDMAFNRNAAPGDEHLLVRFFPVPTENKAKSEAEGRPIFEDVDYIEIRVPGAKDPLYCQPARKNNIDRFPEHYRRYKARMSQEIVSGTPLTEWPGITRGQVEELKFVNVLTVEQLIAMSDTHAQKFMGINSLKEKAKAYLAAAGDQAAANALAESQRQLAEQKELNQSLMARLDALERAAPAELDTPRRRQRAATE